MPEKKSVVTFDTIMRSLKKGEYQPVYLLMGDEPYYIDAITDYIQQHVLTPDEQAFNQDVVFGADVTVGKIVDMAMSYPMMAAHRVVIVKEAQNVRQLDKLEKYLAKPLQTTVLVIAYKNGTVDRRKKWVAGAERNGIVFESKKMRDWQLPGFIKGWLATHKAAADDKSASMIAEHVGADLHRLTSELNKLLVVLPENDRRVTPEVVERNIGISKDFNWFELRDAIVKRDVSKANMIMKYFTSNQKKDTFFTLLPSLYAFFQNLMIAFYVPNRNDPQMLAEGLELRSKYSAEAYLTAMRNYSATKTLQILKAIERTDAKVKGVDNPNTSNADLMQELLFFILH